MERMDLAQEDTFEKYQLSSCFLQRNFFEGGPSLTIPWDESLHIEEIEASVRQRILAQDFVAIMRVLELVILYSPSAPHSAEML